MRRTARRSLYGLQCRRRRNEGESGKAGSFLTLIFAAASPAFAFNPDEVLKDPVLEQRARNLTSQLRCMVCQNQSIDDSNAELARDLRVLVRERLVQGDSDNAVIDYVVSRYGEFVLLKPRLSLRTVLLWGRRSASRLREFSPSSSFRAVAQQRSGRRN